MSNQPPTSPAVPRSGFVWLRNKFFAGLAVALPLVITFWVLFTGYELLRGLSEPALDALAMKINEIEGYPIIDLESAAYRRLVNLVGFLLPVVTCICLGVMVSHVVGVRVVAAVDKLFLRLPVASFIYRMMKQVIDGFKGLGGSGKQNFKRVVYVDYPSGNMKMLGFVTGQFIDPSTEKVMASVFVPGALSPMTGLLLVVPAEQITDAPLTVEDAMKLIFSGGLVVPAHLNAPVAKAEPVLPTATHGEVEWDADEPSLEETPKVKVSATLPEVMPLSLPKAEDFDFGDPDVLIQSERTGTQLLKERSAGRRLMGLFGRSKTPAAAAD